MTTSTGYSLAKTDDIGNESNLRSRDIRSTSTAERRKSGSVSDRTSSISTLISSSSSQNIRVERRRLFPSIKYASRVSHFDPQSNYRDFQGFYVLFWVALTIMVITTVMRNVKDTGYPIRMEIWRLFTVKLWELAYSDGLMILTTAVGLLLHQFFRSKTAKKIGLRWNVGGMAIQSAYQFIWFSFWVAVPFLRDWTWTAQVFLTLHTFVFLMKMHSYAFYNGHLSEIERRLHALDEQFTASPDPVCQNSDMGDRSTPEEPCAKIQETSKISALREDLANELTSPTGSITYPGNLTWSNFFDYLLCPTLCYELEYPRTERIVWSKLGYKILAVFGVIFLLTITSEEFIVPVLAESATRIESVNTFSEIALILAETVSMLLFPFMITFLLVFLIIFEYVLGAFAEITCFADRHFYSDWWNSTDWMEFSRKWNIPVHHFFRRHVYSASSPHIGRRMATFGTFLLSSLGHEIVMACITKKVRGYGFLLQMSQLPIVVVQQTKWVKEKRLLNNVCFWCSIILGTSMICSLYVLC